MCVCVHAYVRTYVWCMCVCMHMCVCVCVCVCCMCANLYFCMSLYMCICIIYTCVHTYIHTYIQYICMYVHMYIMYDTLIVYEPVLLPIRSSYETRVRCNWKKTPTSMSVQGSCCPTSATPARPYEGSPKVYKTTYDRMRTQASASWLSMRSPQERGPISRPLHSPAQVSKMFFRQRMKVSVRGNRSKHAVRRLC